VTHEKLWSWSDKSEGAAFRSTPAVAPDGTVYVVTDGSGGALIAISNTGTTLWTLGLGLQGSPTIGPDGTVYVESASSVLYAVDPQDGQVYWQFAGSEGSIGVRGSPALSPDGQTLYLPSGGGDLYALSAGPTGGSLEWTYEIEGPADGGIENAPAVGPDGTIYIATGGGYGDSPGDIEAVNPDGTPKWAYTSNGTFETTPTVTSTGLVVAGNDEATIVAVQQNDGSLAWSYTAQGGFYNSSPASDATGDIYIYNGAALLALSPTGGLRWTANVSGYGASPAIDHSGTLYLTAGQSLIAF